MLTNPDGEHKLMESNKGAEAVFISTIDILKLFFPGAIIRTTIQGTDSLLRKCGCESLKNPTFSVKTFSPFGSFKSSVNFILAFAWGTIYSYLNLDLKFLRCPKKLRYYYESDLFIHIGMDLYSDDFGVRTIIEHSKDILIGVFLRKPVVLWAESIGPFRSTITRYLAGYTLNRVSLITVREEISKKYLDEIGVFDVPIYTTADPAFLLKPCDPERVNFLLQELGIVEDESIVGMSFSQSFLAGGVQKTKKLRMINIISGFLQYVLPEGLYFRLLTKGRKSQEYTRSYAHYVEELASVADYLIDQYNVKIILVPHIVHPIIGEEQFHRDILKSTKRRDRIFLVEDNINAAERKGLIGRCDIFIGGRMHANIAAISQGIPSIGLAYSYKFKGIMALVGQESYILDKISSPEIIKKVDLLWYNKDSIRLEILSKIENVRKLALKNGEHVSHLVNN